MGYGFKIIAEGEFACFTRPEMKVERVSYDVPTPSAIEGLIKCIYWKPALRFVVDKIIVFNQIEFINVRRNEVKEKVAFTNVKRQMNNENVSPQIFASEVRTQRTSMLLKNAKYGIEFHFELTGFKSENDDDNKEKHYNILLRRLRNGQFFRQPYFGCREFSVNEIKIVNEFDYSQISKELNGDIDLGYMLYGMRFEDGGKPTNNDWENPKFSDKADAIYYRPHMIDGIIDVEKYREETKC